MPMNKPHLEFHKVDMDKGWVTPPGYPSGIQQKILASDLNETKKMGSRTRLLRFSPASTPPRRSCTITGKRFICSPAI